jgi:type I restriction enzyme S subunit
VNRPLFSEPVVLLGEDGAPFFDPTRDVAFRVTEPIWVNNHIHVLRVKELADDRFLTYALNVADYADYISGSTRDKLTQDQMMSIAVPLPPLEEQRRIADFLEDQVARIDKLIELRHSQVELAKLTHASAREATLNAVREGGATSRSLSSLIATGFVQLGRGQVISKDDLAECPGDFPVYSSAQENDGAIGAYGRFMFDKELITWSVDGGGQVFYRQRHKFSVTNICAYAEVLRPTELDCAYLAMAMQSQHSRFNFDWQDKAHLGVVRDLYTDIPIPSMVVQRNAVTSVGTMSLAANQIISSIRQGQTLLTEFKSALISAAVSGEFDVSSASGRGVSV